jgi:hypothetical protein
MTPSPEDTTEHAAEVIHLQTHMTVAADTAIVVTSSKTVKVDLPLGVSVVVSAQSPTTITSGHPMYISTLDNLGEDFARG